MSTSLYRLACILGVFAYKSINVCVWKQAVYTIRNWTVQFKFSLLKLYLANTNHNFKWVNISLICQI